MAYKGQKHKWSQPPKYRPDNDNFPRPKPPAVPRPFPVPDNDNQPDWRKPVRRVAVRLALRAFRLTPWGRWFDLLELGYELYQRYDWARNPAAPGGYNNGRLCCRTPPVKYEKTRIAFGASFGCGSLLACGTAAQVPTGNYSENFSLTPGAGQSTALVYFGPATFAGSRMTLNEKWLFTGLTPSVPNAIKHRPAVWQLPNLAPPPPERKEHEQPRVRREPALKPYQLPAIEITVGNPKGRPEPQRRVAHDRQPPWPSTREEKKKLLYHAAKARDFLTETKDAVDAVADAIKGRPCKGTIDKKMACIYRNRELIDWDQAIKNLVINQVEDAVIGRALGLADKSASRIFRHGRPLRLGVQPSSRAPSIGPVRMVNSSNGGN